MVEDTELYRDPQIQLNGQTTGLTLKESTAQSAVLETHKSLEREKRILQSMVDAARHSFLAYLDRDFNFVRVNESYAKKCGYTPDEMIGKNYFVIFPDEENKIIFKDVRDSGIPLEFHDKPFVFPDQPERDITFWYWTLAPVKAPSGNVEGLLLSLFEATDSKRVEEALRKNERKITSIFRATPIGLGIVNNRIFQEVNEAFCTITGYSRNELIGQSTRIVHASDEDYEYVGIKKYEETDKNGIGTLDTHFKRKNGKIIDVLLSLTPIDPTNLLVGEAFTVLDITERKQMEKDIMESESALWELNVSLEQQVLDRTKLAEDRARKLQTLVGEISLAEQRERQRLAKILHDDLQQLLVGARINSEVLSAQTAGNQKNIAETILDLIDKSLQTSRSLMTELSPPVLRQGLSTVLKWLASWVEENYRLTVNMQIDPCIDTKRDDTIVLLYESVRELLLNVVKHAEVKSALLEIRNIDKNNFQVTISDQGVGFEPTAVPKMKEHGIGLLSIRERIELMGGKLHIKSSPGNGASFSIILPMAALVEQEKGEARKLMTDICKVKTSEEKIRILLVDDHKVVRQGLSTMLNLYPDIQVVGEAADGEEAIEKAQQLQPDVILMDISMPKINGIKATKIIHSKFPYIRIIGLSMHDEQGQLDKVIEAGMSAYCTKDGEIDLLLSEIRRNGGWTK